MVLKFLLAGVISAFLAGGAMFLAMDDEMLAELRADAERMRVSENVPELRRGEAAGGTGTGRVVDRLLGRDDVPAPAVAPTVETPARPEDVFETPPDTGLDPKPDSNANDLPSRVGQRVEEWPPKRGWLDDFLPRRDKVDGPTPVIRESTVRPLVNAELFDTLLEQAALVTIPAARDDAYFNILTFALSEGGYKVAGDLVENFSSPELRDTARQRIGISHASAGRMDAAFAVLDDIEVEALADPIRLEIIRSVTVVREQE